MAALCNLAQLGPRTQKGRALQKVVRFVRLQCGAGTKDLPGLGGAADSKMPGVGSRMIGGHADLLLAGNENCLLILGTALNVWWMGFCRCSSRLPRRAYQWSPRTMHCRVDGKDCSLRTNAIFCRLVIKVSSNLRSLLYFRT